VKQPNKIAKIGSIELNQQIAQSLGAKRVDRVQCSGPLCRHAARHQRRNAQRGTDGDIREGIDRADLE
jgi:hypothetical protein